MQTALKSLALILPLAASLWGAALPAQAETVLHKGNGAEAQTLDPTHSSIIAEQFILKDLFEGLTVFDATGKIVPGTAESWTISTDGLVYAFKLRANAKWSNGDPVTANDFVFSFRRVEDPKEAAGLASLLYPIKNAQAVNSGKAGLDTLGVRAVDDRTLEIALERPTPYLLQILANQCALPVHPASVEKFKADFVKPGNLVSNGAYSLAENVPNDHVTLVKNPNYWDAANVRIDKVISYPIDDQAAAVRRFLAGELDMNFEFPASELKFLKDKLGDQVHVSQALTNDYYAFDTRKPPFDDVRVRRALSMAVDRDFLAEKIFSGARIGSYSFVPDGMAGYAPAKPDFAGMAQLDREDAAKDLLKQAGYGEGGKPLKLTIRFSTNDNNRRIATAVADMWKGLGVEASLENSDSKTHYAYLREGGAFNVARAAWVADYADPENFLALPTSTNKPYNYSHYVNPDYDALVAKSYTEADPAKRLQILHDAEALLARDQPVAPLLSNADLWLVSNKVKGWHDNAANEHLTRFLSKE
jgi:oligopeptide transport system substrate-binding protein